VRDPELKLAQDVVFAMMREDLYSQWLGVEIIDIKPRFAKIRMTIRDEMVNGFGVCHGGIPFSLADSALAFASNTHGKVTVSIENSITYPKAIAVGDTLTATAEEESSSNRLGFYRVQVVRDDDDAIVALFKGTVYKTQKSHLENTDE
jgi:acyl-CoA thioesterase